MKATLATLKWLVNIPAAKQLLTVLIGVIVILGMVVVKQDKKIDTLNDKIEASSKVCNEEKEVLKAGYSEMMMSVVNSFIRLEVQRQMQFDSVITEGKKLVKYSNKQLKKLHIK